MPQCTFPVFHISKKLFWVAHIFGVRDQEEIFFIPNHKSGFELRGIPASAKTRSDIREEEYDRKYDDKK